MREVIFCCGLIFISCGSFAQEQKWQVEATYYLNYPSGSFGTLNPSGSVVYPSPGVPQLNGFDKKGHAAADQGVGIEFILSRSLIKNFSIGLAAGMTSSPVQVAPLNDYLDQVFGYGVVRTSQGNYLTYSLAPGLSYGIQRKRWTITIAAFVGASLLRFPEYDMALSNNGPGDTIVKHEGNKPDSYSLWLSSHVSIRKMLTNRLSLSVTVGYSSANFPYQVALRMVPGGSTTTVRADEVTFRIIKVGIGIGYRF